MATLDKDVPEQGTGISREYVSFLPLCVIAVTSGLVLQTTIQSVFNRWLKFDESYSHGLLLLGISLYLLIRNLRAIWPLQISPNPIGFLALLGGSLVWALAQAISVQVIEEFLLPILFWLPVLSIYGWKQAKQLIVPIGFFYFAIPFWDYLAMPLQLITVAVNEVGFSIAGISAEIDGIFVNLPDIGTFEVAHGCSGLRYLIVGLTLTTLFGYLNYDRWSLRFILIGLGVLFSLAANWIRVFIIIYVGYKTNMQSPLIEDHDMFGWWVFACTLIPLFWAANVLARKSKEPKVTRPTIETEAPSSFKLISSLLAFAAALTIPVGFIKAQNQGELEYYAPIELPSQFGEWKSLHVAISSSWTPVMRGHTQNAQIRYYSPANQHITLFVYLYSTQSPGRELIQDANRLYDYKTWRNIATENHRVIDGIYHNRYALEERANGQRVAVVQGYRVAGVSYSDRVKAKLLQVLGYFKGRYDAAEFFISAECKSDCLDEQLILQNFLQNNGRYIFESLDKAYYASSKNLDG